MRPYKNNFCRDSYFFSRSISKCVVTKVIFATREVGMSKWPYDLLLGHFHMIWSKVLIKRKIKIQMKNYQNLNEFISTKNIDHWFILFLSPEK